jgi:anti-sigma factor ChrR (cupin superfamily)
MKDSDHRSEGEGVDRARWRIRSGSRHPAPAQVSLCRDGGLRPRDAAAIRAHLKSCPRCRRVEAKLSEVRRILAHQSDRQMPPTAAVRIHQALNAEAVRSKGQWPPAPRRATLYS